MKVAGFPIYGSSATLNPQERGNLFPRDYSNSQALIICFWEGDLVLSVGEGDELIEENVGDCLLAGS